MSTYIKRNILIYNNYFLSLKYIIFLIIFILIITISFSSFFSKSNIFSNIEKYYEFYKNEKLLITFKFIKKIIYYKIINLNYFIKINYRF